MFDVSKLIDVVEKVAATIVPVATGMGPAIAAGEAVIALIENIRPTLNESDQAKLDAALPALLTKMNSDVDQAEADLK